MESADESETRGGSEPPEEPEGSGEPEEPEGSGEPEEPEGSGEPEEPEGPQGPSQRRWRERSSIRKMKQEFVSTHDFRDEKDRRDNEASRLEPNESVHVGGIVLVEAFTPSTIASLYAALERLPLERPVKKQELIDGLRDSRSAKQSGGWRSLGMVRAPGTFLGGDGFHDATLPQGVAAVWLAIDSPTPSLTFLIATFSFEEESGDISDILRRDYQTTIEDVHVHVPGRLGQTVARLPWARPRASRISGTMLDVEAHKRRACDAFALQREEECWNWFAGRFRGRFYRESITHRPRMRLLLSKEELPFRGRSNSLDPVGLGLAYPVWRGVDVQGWALHLDNVRLEGHRYVAIAAARRADISERVPTDDTETVWYITQRFHAEQSALVARWAMLVLLAIYADRLSDLRDRAGIRRRIRQPVRQARDLDDFLLGDGLDAATVATDLREFSAKLDQFRWNVAEYIEDQRHLPEEIRAREEPTALVPRFAEVCNNRAVRLLEDMAVTTTNINSSAQLRQALANTRLQRSVALLTIIATLIAVISLVVTATNS